MNRVPQAGQEKRVRQGSVVSQDATDKMEELAIRAPLETVGTKAQKATKAPLDALVILAMMQIKDKKVSGVSMEMMVLPGDEVQMVLPVHTGEPATEVTRDLQDMMDVPALLAAMASKGFRARRDTKAHLALPERLGKMALLAATEVTGRTHLMDGRETAV